MLFQKKTALKAIPQRSADIGLRGNLINILFFDLSYLDSVLN